MPYSHIILIWTTKCSDNRYFYKTVDVELPHVQQVDSNKYKTLVKYIRMTDKTIDIPRVITLPSRQQKLYDLNSTMMVEQGRHRRHTSVLE
jgi:ABC-type transporter Mla MlaB component